jgi:hypothetical protein
MTSRVKDLHPAAWKAFDLGVMRIAVPQPLCFVQIVVLLYLRVVTLTAVKRDEEE